MSQRSTDGSTEGVAPPVPRVLPFVTVKRNAPIFGRSYGHWWVELDGSESYGWWPGRFPLRLQDVLRGCSGVLNGAESGRETPRDPNHGLPADHEFHPVLVAPLSDDEVRQAVRLFALAFKGEWRWSTRPTMNCRVFQLDVRRRRPGGRHRELPHQREGLPGPGPTAATGR
ncbi:MAG: hypothetical protein M3396_06410 [Actinomycetota bacterium]|nr:hypothetical protein [Actinomycetota bacterium]MDQ3574760.1 hypothetical protein [Actinomycetota bacterium]